MGAALGGTMRDTAGLSDDLVPGRGLGIYVDTNGLPGLVAQIE